MSGRGGIDARDAWDLVRSLSARRPPAHFPLTLTARCGTHLTIEADATWIADGTVGAQAREILDLYLPLCTEPEGYVMAQFGQSLDGRIATESGASRYITGPDDLLHLHRLRALADAVIVGAGTAIADDPALTVRNTDGANPVRVIIDTNARTPDDLGVFHDGAATTLLLHADDHPRSPPGDAECIPVPRNDEGLHPQGILAQLAARGLRRVLVEGGGITISRFLSAQLIDRLHVTITPMIIGSGRPAFSLPAIDSLDHALRPAWRRFDLGEDVLFDLDMRA